MAAVESAEKCEEESLQTAFKKLRVDAESSTNTVQICETLAPRSVSRGSPEGTKPKMTSSKENWLGCTRKASRGIVRSQRRRRSKSPILHPPKFTYCSKMSPPPAHLKHKISAEPDDSSSSLGICVKNEPPFSSPRSTVFGGVGYETRLPAPKQQHSLQFSPSDGKSHPEKSCASQETVSENAAPDFQTLCKRQEGGACLCGNRECQCSSWQGVEVYSFTGLRDVISQCERKMPDPWGSSTCNRTHTGTNNGPSSSPRSCSEQARAYVDDITIEDLSGYMEFYLYIPKKMSHMAEMMYT